MYCGSLPTWQSPLEMPQLFRFRNVAPHILKPGFFREGFRFANLFVGSNERHGSTPPQCRRPVSPCHSRTLATTTKRRLRPKPPKIHGSNTRKRRREAQTKIRTTVLYTLHEIFLANKRNVNPSCQPYKSSGVCGSSN